MSRQINKVIRKSGAKSNMFLSKKLEIQQPEIELIYLMSWVFNKAFLIKWIIKAPFENRH